jgi:hypothetical protein
MCRYPRKPRELFKKCCIIQIDMRYPKSLTQTLTNDTTSTEVALESEVSPLLAELFGGVVLIEEVTVRHRHLNLNETVTQGIDE